MTDAAERFLRVVGAPEIYLKSRITRDRFMRMLVERVRSALQSSGLDATVARTGVQEMRIDAADLGAAAAVAANVFGVGGIAEVEAIPYDGLDDLVSRVAEHSRNRVAGRTFAARVKRRGGQEWSSLDAERSIGSALLDDSAGVDLTNPQFTVSVRAEAATALLVVDETDPPYGLPIGSQEKALVLLSGGIDSPVAAWMMMRTGCPVDFLHLEMECSVTDQALSVGHDLVSRWGHGSEPTFHVVDFQPIKEALRERVKPRMRQVLLKQLMLQAAEAVAAELDISMLVTGDSLGQVSSQTGAHLVELDRTVDIPVIRPLVALRKEEIVDRARSIGTFEMSVRTREVCDLSDGHRVATRASGRDLSRAGDEIEPALVEKVVAGRRTVAASEWTPGMPIEPAT